MKPADDTPTAAEYWRAALDTLCFCALSAVVVTLCLAL